MNKNSEDQAVQQPAVKLFEELGWETADWFKERRDAKPRLSERETFEEVVLKERLMPALHKINDLPQEAIDEAFSELTRDRSAMDLADANKQVYNLLKDGYKATFREKGEQKTETVHFIDWNNYEDNDFFLVSEMTITGMYHRRRPDIVGFINGIPLLYMPLKASARNLRHAYDGNFSDYKDTIPQLFWYNAFVILSNGRESKMGSLTAGYGHFSEWKRINDEEEPPKVSLETMIRATCMPERLLDIVENFTLFSEGKSGEGTTKIVAKNHQYLGVNNSVQNLQESEPGTNQLGVFWHTQGSGKSYSMIFFSQKVLRKIEGNWTFVVVTDRLDLDRQIYQNFAKAGVVTEEEKFVRAQSGDDLQDKLQENHRFLFTLIHKFNTQDNEPYPKLSDRDNIIVMTDEAHRTQYDVLALNMRTALPNAKFLGFTGTPLMASEEKTKEVFGDYVSVYDFQQSVEDEATVPLYYEARKPELQLSNENFEEDMERILEEAELDVDQEKLLENKLGKKYHLITRDDRLDTIASDIVEHFVNRGYLGKGMVISIDRFTAVRMYDKVQYHWHERLKALEQKRETLSDEPGALEEVQEKISFMESTDMAVVISQSQNEIRDFKEKGLDIEPHRKRIVSEDLETNFKKPEHPLRLVFVCAMWITGFDAPSVSTIYLDKPMKNHTLMQTIARANRVFKEKNNGLIVDYIGVLHNLRKALSVYGDATGNGAMPVLNKDELVDNLEKSINKVKSIASRKDIDLDELVQTETEKFKRIEAIEEAVDVIVAKEVYRKEFQSAVNVTLKLYRAILPDKRANQFKQMCQLLRAMYEEIKDVTSPNVSVDHVLTDINKLLDESVTSEGYVIREDTKNTIDLSELDIEHLKEIFEDGQKHTATEKLKAMIEKKIDRAVRMNETRINFKELFEQLITEYNEGSKNVEEAFRELVALSKRLDEEEQRAMKEGMNEEGLAIFDILLSKPAPELSKNEISQVKEVAKDLLVTLKGQKLVLDWKKNQQTRAMVQVSIRDLLEEELPSSYTDEIEHVKEEQIFSHVFERYQDANHSIYEELSS